MANSMIINGADAVAGLGTTSYTITSADAGFVSVRCNSTIPLNSGLQIVINQNGTPKVTVGGVATNPTPTQQSIGAETKLQCVAGDVITVVLSSSAAADQIANAVKSVIVMYTGE